MPDILARTTQTEQQCNAQIRRRRNKEFLPQRRTKKTKGRRRNTNGEPPPTNGGPPPTKEEEEAPTEGNDAAKRKKKNESGTGRGRIQRKEDNLKICNFPKKKIYKNIIFTNNMQEAKNNKHTMLPSHRQEEQ